MVKSLCREDVEFTNGDVGTSPFVFYIFLLLLCCVFYCFNISCSRNHSRHCLKLMNITFAGGNNITNTFSKIYCIRLLIRRQIEELMYNQPRFAFFHEYISKKVRKSEKFHRSSTQQTTQDFLNTKIHCKQLKNIRMNTTNVGDKMLFQCRHGWKRQLKWEFIVLFYTVWQHTANLWLMTSLLCGLYCKVKCFKVTWSSSGFIQN